MRSSAAKAAPKKRSPRLPLLIGAGALVVGGLVFVALKMGGGATASPSGSDGKASAASATPDAATPSSGASAPVATPQAPLPPKFDAAAAEQRLAEVKTVEQAVDLAEEVVARLRDDALADRCWLKVLELDPQNAIAQRRLDFRPFIPSTELEGFDDIDLAPQRYLLTEYAALKGRVMGRPEREAARKRWLESKPAFEARAKLAVSDRYVAAIDKTRERLTHEEKFFPTFEYEMVETTAPYALFVQVKGDAAARKKRRDDVESAYKPFLAHYNKKIHSYLFGLVHNPPTPDPTFITFVLLDEEQYQKFNLEHDGHAMPPGVRAHYEPTTKWAITWSPILDVNHPGFAEGCQTLLHELTHAWVDQLASDGKEIHGIEAVHTHWINEGIAEYMSCHFLDHGEIKFQPWRSMRISEEAGRQKELHIPYKTSLAIQNSGQLMMITEAMARDLPFGPKDHLTSAIGSGFYADMSLFIFWLNYGEDGARRERFSDYLQWELAGKGDDVMFDKCFPHLLDDVDLDAVIPEFAKRVAKGAESFSDDLEEDPADAKKSGAGGK